MVVTPRGLITGGDATTQGGENVGRLAFFDFNRRPCVERRRDRHHRADHGPSASNSGDEFTVKGTASAAAA